MINSLGEFMIPSSNFHQPLPGDSAIYYCNNCKKSFSAKVPENHILNIFKRINHHGMVKCPDCKKLCFLDPKIQY